MLATWPMASQLYYFGVTNFVPQRIMDKHKTRVLILYGFKPGYNATETAHNTSAGLESV